MSAETYLIAPPDMDADALRPALAAALARGPVAALLLPQGTRDAAAYRRYVRAIAPLALERDAAVLVEGEPAMVRELGVDGLHVTGGIGAVRAAIAELKPDFIVGVGDVRSRDDAMLKGEAGIDYILFGPLSGPIPPAQRDLAQWWAETMEIPSVLSDPEAPMDGLDAGRCEFAGVTLRAPEAAR